MYDFGKACMASFLETAASNFRSQGSSFNTISNSNTIPYVTIS